MPVSKTELPILAQFFSVVQSSTGMPAAVADAPSSNEGTQLQTVANTQDQTPKRLPKGVVLDKDGKP